MKKLALFILGLALVLSLSVVFATEEDTAVVTSAPETETTENVETVNETEETPVDISEEEITSDLSGEATDIETTDIEEEVDHDHDEATSNNGSVVGAIIAVVIVIAVVAIAAILRKD